MGYSDLFVLSKKDMWDVLKEYPAARVRLEAIAVKRLEKYKKAPLEKGKLPTHIVCVYGGICVHVYVRVVLYSLMGVSVAYTRSGDGPMPIDARSGGNERSHTDRGDVAVPVDAHRAHLLQSTVDVQVKRSYSFYLIWNVLIQHT